MKTAGNSMVVSRRSVVGTSAFCILSALLPRKASAKGISEGEIASELWKEAVKKAQLEGSQVQENIPPGTKAMPFSHVSGASNSLTILIKGVPTVVQAIAAYNAYGNGNIDTCYDAWIQCGSGQSVSHCVHSWTVIDGGKTLAVRYTCSIKSPFNAVETACSFYCEFWSDGSEYLKGGPL